MKREIFSRLLQWKTRKARHPLILKGARQVGKTFILKEFGEKCFPRYHYLNFEEDDRLKKIFDVDLKPRRILNDLSFHLNHPIQVKGDLIILDEIQECPRALTSLKYFSEEMPELALCAAGSLLGLHFGGESFPVGKVDFLSMYPMTFSEFLLGLEEKQAHDFLHECSLDNPPPTVVHDRLWNLLKSYLVTGGLPEIVDIYRENREEEFRAFQLVREKQNHLILSYEADMAKHSGKLNSMNINRLWRNIPAQLGRETDGSAARFKFKDVIPGVRGYSRLSGIVDWLITAGLILKVHIVNQGRLPFAAFKDESVFKLYSFDLGILGAISRLSPRTIMDYAYGTYKGYFAENFVAQEFVASGVDELFSWKEATAEVEFLREIDGRPVPIEIKSGWVTQAKSIKVFAKKYAPPFRIIMSAREMVVDRVNRIHRYPLYLAMRIPFVQ